MKIKAGVKVNGLCPEILLALIIAERIYDKYAIWAGIDKHLHITSLADGTHSHNSLHYSGRAVDIRTRNVNNAAALVALMKDSLTPDYDVVLESDHIHLEFDPK